MFKVYFFETNCFHDVTFKTLEDARKCAKETGYHANIFEGDNYIETIVDGHFTVYRENMYE